MAKNQCKKKEFLVQYIKPKKEAVHLFTSASLTNIKMSWKKQNQSQISTEEILESIESLGYKIEKKKNEFYVFHEAHLEGLTGETQRFYYFTSLGF